ncbi:MULTISPECIES: carbohydrate ABC transporter permease [unclassified Oceanispirochaeta]|uniref:carbohydrate ABC transporter permease n=1 Tax=unclassified Oceanispirochaeta TaxID=2635722 RepID=UPI000E08DDEC|nr:MULTISPECIES: sugar ABC transporter permease [unclassified Oceanispirochaeta]MBF9018985.1 sugar ABC transporter permease [Oceanispirochaeta sp. M2]NPD75485.1 sugar ABC transporter permease [Oceanispirochaeta sp. M1]RDG28663.1 sugar ABC transporter permease [Oceanispirochaeta sp. M1]
MTDKLENRIVFWTFLSPIIFAFLMVVIIPFLIGAFYSFTNWSSAARANEVLEFVGFKNFTDSFADPSFNYSFILTIIYTVINMLAINITAFLLAIFVTSKLKFRNIYRVGFFIPNLIGGLILGYIWQFIFNNAIPSLGEIVPALSFLADPRKLILANRNSAVLALVAVGTWQYAGYIMMIYVAALESVPAELHEAARIDGANVGERIRHITIPMIAQAFTITMFLTLVQSFKQFDVNVSLTAGGPSAMFMGIPLFGTELLALNIYNTAFVKLNMAMAQAQAVIFFLVLIVISMIQVSVNKRKEVEM